MNDNIARLYRLLGWDCFYVAQDLKTWDNPNDLDIADELEILVLWTKRNQWRRFTRKDYRMRFQAWLRRTKREKTNQIQKIETKTIAKQSKPIDIYQHLPDRDGQYEAFVAEVIKRYKSGAITAEYLESAASDDPISGVIGLFELGYLGGK